MPVCPATAIAYDRAGPAGPTVVLLHAGVADRRMWDPQWPTLTERYDGLRLDLRGFGDSTTRQDRLAHHEDVIATLDALGVERAHLVGASLGAGVAVEVALARPDLVASLLLAAPGGALIPAMTPELRSFIDAEDAALERGDLDAAVQTNLDWWLDGPRRDAEERRAGLRATVTPMQRRAFELTADWDDVEQAELEPPALDRLAEVAVPTLVLAGGLDLDAIDAATDAVVAGVPGVRHEVWADTAHLPTLERPDDFTALLERWLDEVG